MSCGNNCAGCKCGNTDRRTPEDISAYYAGLVDGVYMYAWWKDGVQYVGTTGKTWRQALAEMEAERAEELAK